MRFLKRAKKKAGWLIIAVLKDGVAAATVRPGADGLPVVCFARFLSGQSGVEVLEKAAREGQAHAYRCATLLAGGEYQLISIEAPRLAREEIKTAVRWRLKDLLDFPVEEATVDVLDIPLDAGHTRTQQSVYVVTAHNSIIRQRQQLFLDAKVDLRVIDIPEMAQRNVSALLAPEGRGVAMLSFGQEGGLLTVTWQGELYLSRRFDMGVDQLLDPDHERKHASFDRITLELQRSLDNFERQYSFISIARLVLGPSPVSGLEEYLSSNLYMPVETLDLAKVFDLSRAPELRDAAAQQRFFILLGAALRPEEGA